MVRLVISLAAAVLSMLPRLASAADGVIEINQVAALAGGITPGDAPGFPVTIDRPGSYALTGNLTVVEHSVSGIHVTSPDVNIDLHGFAISGPGNCTGDGSALSCVPVGNGVGIVSSPTPRVGIQNGIVRGFGFAGIWLSEMARIFNLLAEANGGDGIIAEARSIVSHSVAARNGLNGITARSSVVERCIARANKLAGIDGRDSSFVGINATFNGSAGINAGRNSVVRDSVANENAGDGIVASSGSLVSDNSATQNGAAGISVLSTSSVQRNIVTDNVLFGLYLVPEHGGTAAAYRENVISGGSFGAVAGGINMGDNSCNGATTCP